jgi:hypothetical protein
VYDFPATPIMRNHPAPDRCDRWPHRGNAACTQGIAPSSELKHDLAVIEFAPTRLLPDGFALAFTTAQITLGVKPCPQMMAARSVELSTAFLPRKTVPRL